MITQKNIVRIKKIFLIISIFIVLIISAAASLSYIYKDSIISYISKELNKHLQGEITIEEVSVSFLSNFPHLSIHFHNIVGRSTDSFAAESFAYNTDTAFQIEKFSAVCNIFQFARGRYVLNELSIKHASIHFYEDAKQNHNMHFIEQRAKDSEHSIFVELSKITLTKVNIHYHSLYNDIHTHNFFEQAELKGSLHGERLEAQLIATHTNHFCYVQKSSYTPHTSAHTKISFIKTDNKLVINSIEIASKGIEAAAQGSIEFKPEGEQTDLSFTLKIPNIAHAKYIVSQEAFSIIEDYDMQAAITATGTIKGINSNKRSPGIDLKFKITKGSITYDSYTYTIDAQGTIESKQITQAAFYSLSQGSYAIKHRQSVCNGELTINNFSNATVKTSLHASLRLEDIAQFIQPEGYLLSGKVEADAQADFKLHEVDFNKPSFFKILNPTIQATLHNVNLESPSYSPYNFKQLSGTMNMENQKIVFDNIHVKIQDSECEAEGYATNVLEYILYDKQHAHINAQCKIGAIDITPFMQYTSEQSEEQNSTNSISMRVALEADYVKYEQYEGKQIKTILIYDNNQLEFTNAYIEAMQGKFDGTFKIIFLNNGSSKLYASGFIDNVSAKELFKTSNNFDQSFLTHSQISGSISTTFTFYTVLDALNNPDYKTMKLNSNIIMKNGAIIDFEPFVEMGKKMKVTEFNHVKFDEIKNNIKIETDTLYIPNMNIATNAFDINFSGKHKIQNNQFSYQITVLMKKTLAQMFKQKNKEDFGEVEENKDGNIRLPLRIHGNPNKYSIDFNLKSTKETIKQSLETQKKEWHTILKKDEKDKKDDNTTKKNTPEFDSGFSLEYD